MSWQGEPAAARFGGVDECCAYTSKCGLFGAVLHSSAVLLQPLLNVCFHASLKSLFSLPIFDFPPPCLVLCLDCPLQSERGCKLIYLH